MPIPAQRHAMKRHPDDFPRCLPFLSEVIETPSLCGQSPHHADGFELVKEIDDEGLIVLVALNIERSSSGLYIATSTYVIDQDKAERRVRKKHLIYV